MSARAFVPSHLRGWLQVCALIVVIAGLALAVADVPFHLPYSTLRVEPGGVTGISGVVASDLYVAPANTSFKPPSERVLSGAIGAVQGMPASRFFAVLGVLAAFAVIGAGVALATRVRRAGVVMTLVALMAISGVGALRLSDGWDEFYINLKHAQNIVAHGTYSMNAAERVEATVDLVPFATAGLVSRATGVLPDNIAMAFGFTGNVLLIAGAFLFVAALTASTGLALGVAAFVAVFPPLLFVGFSGFMATFFAGLILVALYWLLVRRGRWAFRAYLLLGALTLVRVEAVALGLLLWGLTLVGSLWRHRRSVAAMQHGIARTWRVHSARLLAAFLPFVLLSLARLAFFGHAMPVPVVFKNTGGDPGYLFSGALQIRKFYYAFHLAPALLVCAVPVAVLLVRRGWRWVSAALAVLLFSLTYLTGGGDWFPENWARYWLPLFSVLIVLSASALFETLRGWRVRFASGAVVMLFALFAGQAALTPGNAFFDAKHALEKHPAGWKRVDDLARLGSFFNRMSEPSWRVGTPEVATINFFAERDLVGLIGIDNWDIARAPLMPLHPGDRLHRRREPATLERRRPELLALYEPAASVKPYASALGAQREVQHLLMPDYAQEIGYYRAGSYDFLQALGYRSLTAQEGTHIFTYWVHESVLAAHVARLTAAGFTPQGVVHIPYAPPDSTTRRFRPATGAFAALHALRADAAASIRVTGAMSEHAVLPTLRGAPPPGVVYSSLAAGRTRGALRIALTPTSFGELRIPIALGPTDGNVTMALVRAADHAVIQDVPVPQGVPKRWLLLRVKVPGGREPLELVIEDHGAVGGWFAAGRPWWMGEGSPFPPAIASRAK